MAAQWFCWWPPKATPALKGELLVQGADRGSGRECFEDTTGPLVVGVEDNVGHGAAVAFCGQVSDGRWVVGGEVCENRAAAYQLANMAVQARDGSQVVVGASLSGDPALDELGVTVHRAGRGETPSASGHLQGSVGDRAGGAGRVTRIWSGRRWRAGSPSAGRAR